MTQICVSKLTIIGSDSGLSPDVSKCWNIFKWTLRKKLQWKVIQCADLCIFIQGNSFQNVVWKMAAMLPRIQCVYGSSPNPPGTLFTIKLVTFPSKLLLLWVSSCIPYLTATVMAGECWTIVQLWDLDCWLVCHIEMGFGELISE